MTNLLFVLCLLFLQALSTKPTSSAQSIRTLMEKVLQGLPCAGMENKADFNIFKLNCICAL
jgi:hypothetical protein